MDDKLSDEELFKKDQRAYWLRRLREKYKPYLTRQGRGKGGIFTTTMRGNLLGIAVKGRKKRDNTYDFRYDVRNTVRTALVDLELFIETANQKDVDIVINEENLSSLVHALLNRSAQGFERAIIAQMLAECSLEYLVRKSKYVTKSQKQIMEDAIETSKQLTLLLIPENERGKVRFYLQGESIGW
jgi:hypothetical protein